ncbi:MAG: hypothetical protein O9301_10065 [Leptospira sp.]|nr:hypothetical protein [Leptospira sp.]
MNSKNRKNWELLLEDSKLEERIVRKAVVRYNNEKRNKSIIITSLSLVLFLGSVITNEFLLEPVELSNTVASVIDELVSDSTVFYE